MAHEPVHTNELTPAEEIRNKIEELTKQRAAFLEQAQAEVNHKLGVFDGRILELKLRLEQLEERQSSDT